MADLHDYDPFEPDVPPLGRGPADPALAMTSGEARMWVAVMRGVLVDLDSARYRDETRQWLVSTATEAGSFQWICESLKIEPEPLRRRLLQRPAPSARRPTLPSA